MAKQECERGCYEGRNAYDPHTGQTLRGGGLRVRECDDCGASGRTDATCEDCDGHGEVEGEECEVCQGEGFPECGRCNGRGEHLCECVNG